jgi:hypothetical protein
MPQQVNFSNKMVSTNVRRTFQKALFVRIMFADILIIRAKFLALFQILAPKCRLTTHVSMAAVAKRP